MRKVDQHKATQDLVNFLRGAPTAKEVADFASAHEFSVCIWHMIENEAADDSFALEIMNT